MELAPTFDSSCDLQEGDSITFSLPHFRGADVTDEAKVDYAGADAEKPRLPPATFDLRQQAARTRPRSSSRCRRPRPRDRALTLRLMV